MTSSFIWLCVILHRAMITHVCTPWLYRVTFVVNRQRAQHFNYISPGNCQLKFTWLAKLFVNYFFNKNLNSQCTRGPLAGLCSVGCDSSIERVCVCVCVRSGERRRRSFECGDPSAFGITLHGPAEVFGLKVCRWSALIGFQAVDNKPRKDRPLFPFPTHTHTHRQTIYVCVCIGKKQPRRESDNL